jgi:hypothetical protein
MRHGGRVEVMSPGLRRENGSRLRLSASSRQARELLYRLLLQMVRAMKMEGGDGNGGVSGRLVPGSLK